MRIILVPAMALLLVAADEPSVPATDPSIVTTDSRMQADLYPMGPVQRMPVIEPDGLFCNDQVITASTDAEGLAPERDPADAENPLLYYAMDHRVDDCSMLVLKEGRLQLPPAPREEAQVDPAQ